MLQIKNICKEYQTGDLIQKALDDVSLNLRDSEFVAILGPSGSGKTTLLNIIGGLDRYDSGDLIINDISTKKYKDRDWDSYRNHTIGFVFQSYNLIPHQTILSNVELALTISGISKSERKERAKHALDQVGLVNQYHKKPNQLSGGQMQRVAIARALVNNPEILLADEPTGALDSDTSIQVMDLLKEVAKDRLVVMVTHNPELAKDYATRIVNLKDGKILSDTNPYIPSDNEAKEAIHQKMAKTSMSHLTSLALSFNNLKTKKARTILTSFAGSIGIIGIALILSLSTGVNSYIKSVEEDTLSEYPLQIQSTGFDLTSMMVGAHENMFEKADGEVMVAQMVTNMFSKIGSNDLASLKEYHESGQSHLEDYTNLVDYTYNVIPQIYSPDTTKIRQINPNQAMNALGFSYDESSSAAMSSSMMTNVFNVMPSNIDLFSDQYDVKAGHWPQKEDELVLILTPNGSISDFFLYTLGLRNPDELDVMIQKFAAEEEVVVPDTTKLTYQYEDFLGITFKLVNAFDKFEYDSTYQVYKNKADDTNYMRELVENGKELKIVGVVQAKEGATATMLPTGVYYPSSLVTYLMNQATTSDIVKAQLASPEIDVFTGKRFDDDSRENTFDMSSMFSINTDVLQSAFQVDESKLNVDLSGLNDALNNMTLPPLDIIDIISKLEIKPTPELSHKLLQDLVKGYQSYIQNTPEADFGNFTEQFQSYIESPEVTEKINQGLEDIIQSNQEISVSIEQLNTLLLEVMNGYSDYASENGFADPSKISEHLKNYLQSNEAKEILSSGLASIMEASGLEEQISKIIQEYTQSFTTVIEEELTQSMNEFAKSMAGAISFDANVFASAIEMKMTEQDFSELMMSMMKTERASYENNLRKLGYADFAKPSGINIYPKDFESKEMVLQILDTYNENMKAEGSEDKVITYTDFVGALMSSVTNIINVISYVLIAFVAISLVVSSIMIGVITYISVLERKKEIGILRAMGASKRNISQVFNAETFIIGLFAGIIGIGITLLLLIPGNQIIHAIAGQDNINAFLPMGAGVILVILSVILTLIGGIIPSRKAAKEDPVTALRTE